MTVPRKRSGFSLAEILVAIAIVAVIAAVVIPSFGSQLRSGDEGRVQQDLTNVRSAIEQFLADVRRYPNSIGQLTNAPLVAHSALVGGVYKASQVSRWRGPYISKDSVSALLTGFDASITTAFDTVRVGGNLYLEMEMVNFDSTNATRLDVKMDDGVLTTGLVKWVGTAYPLGTLSYLGIPVQ
jgi:prepilin-type N-terminal cleavage/methylation domain-containing protein